MLNISEILEYGPICAADHEMGYLVTVNGAYVNLWVGGPVHYENVDALANSAWGDLYTKTGAQMIDRAEACLKVWLEAKEEEDI